MPAIGETAGSVLLGPSGPRVPRSGAPLIESVEKIVTPDGHTYAVRCEVELEGEDVSDLGPRLPQHWSESPNICAIGGQFAGCVIRLNDKTSG